MNWRNEMCSRCYRLGNKAQHTVKSTFQRTRCPFQSGHPRLHSFQRRLLQPPVRRTTQLASRTLVLGNWCECCPSGKQGSRCSSDATIRRTQACDHFQTISFVPSYFECCITPPRTWLISSTLHSLQTGKLFVRNLCCSAKTVSARKGS